MKFSEIFKQGNNLASFSPNGQYIASTSSQRLVIREVKSLQVLHLFTCLDEIEIIEWSPDSCYILCGLLKRRIVQVWSVEKPQWTCKIDECSLGLINARWGPDSRHILTTTKFYTKITIWSLITKSLFYMKYAKPINNGLVFRDDGKYLALAERRDCRDHISLFECSNWILVKHFEVGTKDLAGISFSPNGDILCAWETLTEDIRVFFYFLDGKCIGNFTAPNPSLGIKTTTWSPTSQFFVIGGYDHKVRLINHITWRSITEFMHQVNVTNPDSVIYKEVEAQPYLHVEDIGDSFQVQSKYEVVNHRPFTIPHNPIEAPKPYPRHGIGTALFSANGRYLATIEDRAPTTLWIWNIEQLSLTDILVHSQPIKSLAWEPNQTRLALCTGGNNIYLWTPAGCLAVAMPYLEMKVHTIKWRQPGGEILLLIGKESLCLSFLASQ